MVQHVLFFWFFEKSASFAPSFGTFKVYNFKVGESLPHPRCLTCSTVSRPMCPHDRDGPSTRDLWAKSRKDQHKNRTDNGPA